MTESTNVADINRQTEKDRERDDRTDAQKMGDTMVKAMGEDQAGAKSAIADYMHRVTEIEIERDQLTARKRAARETLEGKFNMNRKALDAARAFSKLSDEKRAGFDATYLMARAAIGAPVQFGLFHNSEGVEDS